MCFAHVQVPVAVACSAPEARVQPVLETTGLAPALEAVVTAEDVYRGRPDPEAYLLAAQRLQRPPMRCVVIGNSNQVLLLPTLHVPHQPFIPTPPAIPFTLQPCQHVNV